MFLYCFSRYKTLENVLLFIWGGGWAWERWQKMALTRPKKSLQVN